MRYLLTGDHFDAAEALRIGVIQEVVPTGTLPPCWRARMHRKASRR
jgi:enoyl-CoA hydratase/carnithine racemase